MQTACCRHDLEYPATEGNERIFEVEAPRIKYGRGALREVGAEAAALGLRRIALFTDARIRSLEIFETVRRSLADANLDVALYDAVLIEPTDRSFKEASAFARDGRFDGYVSLGGGSVIDTAKAANLYATHPADFMAYVNAPLGEGRPVPGPLAPHIACPTTSGTGSECTGITIFDLLERSVKTGIASKRLRPSLGVIDPDAARTLPSMVVACSGFDVLSHALESFTALPYTERSAPGPGAPRPMSQGANPFSDIACLEALRILGAHLVRAVRNPGDEEARERMMYAATLAGIGFGNAGVHAPHGMAYAVAGLVHDYHAPEYPGRDPIVPHGMSVIVNAPAVFRFTADANPLRHLEAAATLGADLAGAAPEDAGERLGAALIELMRQTSMPLGLAQVGYGEGDLDALTDGAFAQQRLLRNAPRPIERPVLRDLFRAALAY